MYPQCHKNHLRLDETTHKYYLHLPSASTILDLIFGEFDNQYIPKHYLINAQKQGTCVHKQMEDFVKSGFSWGCGCADLSNETQNKHEQMFESMKQKFEANIWEYKSYLQTEVVMSNGLVNGTADLIKKIDGVTTIIDYKTTSQEYIQKWRIQLFIYAWLYDPTTVDNCQFKVLRTWNDKPNKTIKSKIYELEAITNKEVEQVLQAVQTWHDINCRKGE